MGDDFDVILSKSSYGIIINILIISSADICCGLFMYGLKTQLYPHGLYMIQFG